MKKFLYVAMLAVLPLTAMAQHEEDTENGVVSLAEEKVLPLKQRKVTLFSSLICWYKRVLISIGMMMKAWIRLITKIILPIRVFPFLMPYLALLASFWKSGFQSVHQCCCKWRSAVTAGVV